MKIAALEPILADGGHRVFVLVKQVVTSYGAHHAGGGVADS